MATLHSHNTLSPVDNATEVKIGGKIEGRGIIGLNIGQYNTHNSEVILTEHTFKVPLLPESVNSLYKINYKFRTVYMSDEGRSFKYNAKLFMPPMQFSDNSRFSLSVEYHGDWYCKNGSVKRSDMQNLDKLVIDTIFEHIGIDDKFLWELHTKKVLDVSGFMVITLRGLDEHK